jgi:two-component system, sensor histidine kinase and response regulator
VKILVAEDNTTSRKLLRALLESEEFEVVEAADGVEALDLLRRETIDVVISDILMPNLDGFRLCYEIRRTPALAHLPFVVYTSTYNSPADRQLSLTVGADDFITKPASAPVLLEAIVKAVERSKAASPPALAAHDENYVLKRYSAALVQKLEHKNAELEAALAEVRSSHEAILDLNIQLESRVEGRTMQLAEANRDLEAFSVTVSHDLRAPLRRISGFAHVLESRSGEGLDDDARATLRAIQDSVREMARLIEDLLAFSKAGRVEMKREAVDLDRIIDDVLCTMDGELAERRIQWERQPLPRVAGDPTLLRQVFVNLLGNAVKYTRPRDPARIRLTHESTQQGRVTLCVRDNGVGFDAASAQKLFGVFQRLHRADEFEGTGIGLAIVQRVVERHSGRIWAEAAPEQGAAFYFTLPAA